MAKAISIIDKVLDSTTLAAMYISNKIRYNPRSYSLKDKLLAVSLDGGLTHAYNINYGAEDALKLCIVAAHPSTVFSSITWRSGKDYRDQDIPRSRTIYPRVISGTPCFVKHDDMYFKPEAYFRYDNLSWSRTSKGDPAVLDEKRLKALVSDDEFNAMLQLHIALSSDSSIAKHLIWQMTEYADKPLSFVHNMDMVSEALEAKGAVPDICVPNVEACMVLPVNTDGDVTAVDSFRAFGVEPTGLRSDSALRLHRTSYTKCIIYGLEVLHALYTIHNPAYVNILEQMLLRNCTKFTDMMYTTNAMGRLTLSVEAETIARCDDPEVRYNLIREFIVNHTVWEDAGTFVYRDAKSELPYVPEWLLETCAFCNELAVWNMRIRYLSILYKYCADNDLIDYDELNEDEIDFLDEALSAAKEVFGDLDPDTAAVSEDSSLMDVGTKRKCSKHAPPAGPTGDVPPTIEALDKLKASYEDDRYTFDVSDEVCTTPNATYTAIASKTELLNKTLIKRIKDIKVYNTGGKCPGLSRGKLDRKALYKYRTCKDIFYDNTYKVKESDLAFGLILDVSGSMRGDGIANGKATMIILHETLKALGINHSIITHTSDGKYHSEIKRYQAFREDKTYSTLKNYALGDISACWGNCDSGALFYMEKALSRVKNKDKVCIMFSDGEPTECTGTDLKEQVAKMERLGIKVIGVGINYSNIKNYYNEYANGKNLAEMFDIVAGILKRYVLEKED